MGRCPPLQDEFDVGAALQRTLGRLALLAEATTTLDSTLDMVEALRRASRFVAAAEEAKRADAVGPWPAPPGPVATHSRRSKTVRASSQCWVWGFFRSGWRTLKLWARARLSPPMMSG